MQRFLILFIIGFLGNGLAVSAVHAEVSNAWRVWYCGKPCREIVIDVSKYESVDDVKAAALSQCTELPRYGNSSKPFISYNETTFGNGACPRPVSYHCCDPCQTIQIPVLSYDPADQKTFDKADAICINEKKCGKPRLGACPIIPLGQEENKIDELKRLKNEASDLNKLKFSTVQQFIGQGIKALTAFMGTILLVMYVYAGLLWMLGRGNAEEIDKSKRIFIWSTLGAVVMLASYILVDTLFGLLK